MSFNNSDFYLCEYAYQCIESAKYNLEKMKIIKNAVNDAVFFSVDDIHFHLDFNIYQLEASITSILSKTYEERLSLFEDLHSLQLLIDNTQFYYKPFEEATEQRTHYLHNECNTNMITYLNKQPLNENNAYLALDRAFDYFITRMFGNRSEYLDVFVTGAGVHGFTAISYRRGLLRSAGKYLVEFAVPTIDVLRTRRWSAIAHEVAHQTLVRKAINEQESFNEFDSIHNNLSISLLDLPLSEVSAESKLLLYYTLREIICDIASVLMVGPASPFVFLTSKPSLSSIGLSSHPPTVVRIDYMLRILKHLVEIHGPTELSESLPLMEDGWTHHLDVSIEAFENESVNQSYVDRYSSFIEAELEPLITFVQNRIIRVDESERFLPWKWDLAKQFVEEGLQNDFSEKDRMDLSSILNISWLVIEHNNRCLLDKWVQGENVVIQRIEEKKQSDILVNLILSHPLENIYYQS